VYLYLLRCADDTLYCGIAVDPQKRLAQHLQGKGSRYVASRLPAALVYREGPFETRGDALRRELQVKGLSRAEKLRLIDGPRSPGSSPPPQPR